MDRGSDLIALRERVEWLEAENAELRAAMGCGQRFNFPAGVHLSKSENKFLGLLFRREFVSKDMFCAVFYGGRNDSGDPKIADVFLVKMRRKLGPLGITISTEWGQGWRLDAASRDILATFALQEQAA